MLDPSPAQNIAPNVEAPSAAPKPCVSKPTELAFGKTEFSPNSTDKASDLKSRNEAISAANLEKDIYGLNNSNGQSVKTNAPSAFTDVEDQALFDNISKINQIRNPNLPIEQDPRIAHLNSLYEQLDNLRNFTVERIQGENRNISEAIDSINRWGWIPFFGKHFQEAAYSSAQTDLEVIHQLTERLGIYKEGEDQSREVFKIAIEYEMEGRRLEQKGEIEEAQKYYNAAQENFIKSECFITSAIERVKPINANYETSNKILDDIVEELNETEKRLREARNACVYVAAATATGGLSIPGYLAVGVGFGAGVGVGFGSSIAETGMGLATGQMNGNEALSTIKNNFKQDANTAFIASLSAGSASFVAKKFGAPGSRLILTKSGRVFISSAAGATFNGTSSILEISEEYIMALKDFHECYGDLPIEKQKEYYAKFMEERGLSVKDMCFDLGHDIIIGSIYGGIGGRFALSRVGAGEFRALTSEINEAAVSMMFGFASAYVRNGEITKDDLIAEIQGAIAGTLQGHVTQRNCMRAKYHDGMKISYDGEATTLNVTGSIGGMEVVTSNNKNVFRRMYEAVRGVQVSPEKARAESENIMGFIDPYKRQVLIYDSGNNTITESLKIHEQVHVEGTELGNSLTQEVNAYKKQVEFLQKNGYTIDFSEEGASIRKLAAGEKPAEINVNKIEEFVRAKIDTGSRVATANIRTYYNDATLKKEGEATLLDLKRRNENGEISFSSSQESLKNRQGYIRRGNAVEMFVIEDYINRDINHEYSYSHSQKLREQVKDPLSRQKMKDFMNEFNSNCEFFTDNLGKKQVRVGEWTSKITENADGSISFRKDGFFIECVKNSNGLYELKDMSIMIGNKKFHSLEELSDKLNSISQEPARTNNGLYQFEVGNGDDCWTFRTSSGNKNDMILRADGGLIVVCKKNSDTNSYEIEVCKMREFDCVVYKNNSADQKPYEICEIKESVDALFGDKNHDLHQQLEQIAVASSCGAKKYRLYIGDGRIPIGSGSEVIPQVGRDSRLTVGNIDAITEAFREMKDKLPDDIEIELSCGDQVLIWNKNKDGGSFVQE